MKVKGLKFIISFGTSQPLVMNFITIINLNFTEDKRLLVKWKVSLKEENGSEVRDNLTYGNIGMIFECSCWTLCQSNGGCSYSSNNLRSSTCVAGVAHETFSSNQSQRKPTEPGNHKLLRMELYGVEQPFLYHVVINH
ncbi:unnamed protein product [Lactuca virosa]|uniref:Apple domain-containing protein n=1 Tax=Lactuca virosa TaxID=75947 RepID=A0AAU9NMB0_9ASTR|nr:unnamed protein product [Lactuca virosa]